MKKLTAQQINLAMAQLQLKQANERYDLLRELNEKCLKAERSEVKHYLDVIQNTINTIEDTIQKLSGN
jgi:hypothetical protein